ncbi:hypothetical protein FISHEDRAFT_62739 [Fistulina hepatica ATCC 64428]|nr:hypothetical protein FISHEDRAFT_62739 [Fistulina hepatica ATCC 64428]
MSGDISVRFSSVRWDELRATEGWAALQYHAILHGTMTIHSVSGNLVNVEVQLQQGSYFTILPRRRMRGVQPRWYMGNIYPLERSAPHVVSLDPELGEYDVYISGHLRRDVTFAKIRLFGDPRDGVPIQTLNFKVNVLSSNDAGELYRSWGSGTHSSLPLVIEHYPSHDVVPDFIEGISFGDAIGIGLRALHDWWTITTASCKNCGPYGINLELLHPIVIASSQVRIIPVRIGHGARLFKLESLTVDIEYESLFDLRSHGSVVVTLPVHQISSTTESILATYFFANSMPTAFYAIPPVHRTIGLQPVLLALHGAGVDIYTTSFWQRALPRSNMSWTVVPSGRTSWGLDWHGPSTRDAWESLEALRQLVYKSAKDVPDQGVVLLGHSNGGQGAWYMAARFPDRVLGVVPAAAYLKSQAYVPWTMSRSAHYVDPALRAVLDASLTPDDNDLFISNLMHTPVLAIHGGSDENVPVWHTREAVSVLKTWNPLADVDFHEEPGQPHWYNWILDNPYVHNFTEHILLGNHVTSRQTSPAEFTLTVSIPAESGPLRSFAIEALQVPDSDVFTSGRYQARDYCRYNLHSTIVIDDTSLDCPGGQSRTGALRFVLNGGQWEVSVSHFDGVLPKARMQALLNTDGPITLVIPDGEASQELNTATRIAHDLDTYHKLDSEVVYDRLAVEHLANGTLGAGSIVVIGLTASMSGFGRAVLAQNRTPFSLSNAGHLMLNGKSFAYAEGLGALFLHPHPTNANGLLAFVVGLDAEGLERAARLFPIRTGVTVPDWIVIGRKADAMGSGGVLGAG